MSTSLSFSTDGTEVIAHAGNVATRLLADPVTPAVVMRIERALAMVHAHVWSQLETR